MRHLLQAPRLPRPALDGPLPTGTDRGRRAARMTRTGDWPAGLGLEAELVWAAGSVVDRLVDSGPEVEPHRQPLVAGVRPLHHDDRRHVLGGIVVPGGAVETGPSVAPDRWSEGRPARAHRHPETP